MALSTVLRGCIILAYLNGVHSSAIRTYWGRKVHSIPVILYYNSMAEISSESACAVYCSNDEHDLISYENGQCYCSTSYKISEAESSVFVTSIFVKIKDRIHCQKKGYSPVSLEYCLKYGYNTNWTSAAERCHQDGGYLVNLETDEKYNTIAAWYVGFDFHDRVFVGGKQNPINNDQFLWTRGGIAAKYWAPGEPNIINEECAELRKINGTHALNDINCGGTLNFICEILLT